MNSLPSPMEEPFGTFQNLLLSLKDIFHDHAMRDAFYINSISYTYDDLARRTSTVRKAIQTIASGEEKNFGLILNDDIWTYSAILALWMEGRAYVPLNPENPIERNDKIIRLADLQTILDSTPSPVFPHVKTISTSLLEETNELNNLSPALVKEQDLAYIFFTSGTTGEPKGVPITRSNIAAFISAFDNMGLTISAEDRVLQMFDLSFDLSVMSYLVPLLHGACVYTIPKNVVKYNYIPELMEEQRLTVALMVPSILHYLRKYFDEIHLPHMRYSLFCGEALPLDVTDEWGACLPNAEIYNVYGPTENTIFCTTYKYSREGLNKQHNGILSIGSAMLHVTTVIVDDKNMVLPPGEIGELCLAGALLTPGYWKNDAKNKEAFIMLDIYGKPCRFYKTGDLCKEDQDGDILYLGRTDFQTKIQGFRVEISEIEFHVKALLDKYNIAAIAYTNNIGNTEIGLAIEAKEFDTTYLMNKLKEKIPSYMIPSSIHFFDQFPLNANGKTDRKVLQKSFS